jgi:hypothetical protein
MRPVTFVAGSVGSAVATLFCSALVLGCAATGTRPDANRGTDDAAAGARPDANRGTDDAAAGRVDGSGGAVGAAGAPGASDARDSSGVDGDTSVESTDATAPLGSLVWRVLNPPQLGTEAIRAIWGSGANDVYAGGDLGILYHLGKSGTWSQHAFNGKVNAIWGSGASDVYVGADAAGVFHSTGDDDWVPATLPDAGATEPINGVWGSAADNVYAVGGAGVLHFANGLWTSEGDPAGGFALYGVWGSGAADVYTFKSGGDTVWRSKGDGFWASEFTEAPNLTPSLWGSGAGDVYMTLAPYNLTMGPTLVIHSTGKGDWSTQLSADSQRLLSVWGSGSRDVYAAGVHVDASNDADSGVLYHSGGDSHWTPVAGLPPLNVIYCVGGTGPADVYLGGLTFDIKGVLVHGTAQ